MIVDTFAAAREAYLAAKAACDAYDAEHIDPVITADEVGPERNAQVYSIAQAVWEESGRLDDFRFAAEDRLMAIPSPDAAAFALKVFVCCGEGRALHGYDDLLAKEAHEFAIAADERAAVVTEQCNRCRFWLEETAHRDPNDANWGFGYCRRKSPVVSSGLVSALLPPLRYNHQADPFLDAVEMTMASRFPATHSGDWCGKFKKAEG